MQQQQQAVVNRGAAALLLLQQEAPLLLQKKTHGVNVHVLQRQQQQTCGVGSSDAALQLLLQ